MDSHNRPGYNMRLRLSLFILFISALSCTSSRWVTQDELIEDVSRIHIVDSIPVLSISDLPSNDKPSFTLMVMDKQLLKVPLRLRATRVIQRYRPRYSLIALGLVAASGLVYLASHEGIVDQNLTKTQKNVLYVTAGGVLAGSILNMKPVGNPIQTGETRLLGQIETLQKVDSSQIYRGSLDLIINAAYNGESIVTGLQKTINGQLEINLLNDLGLRTFSPPDDGNIQVQVTSEFEVLEFEIPLSSFMNRYLKVATRNTPLRDSPNYSSANVITSVAESSLLPWVANTDDGWHRVLLGSRPVYVPSTEGDLIWRFGSGRGSELVVTTSAGTYGSVDIERDIPITNFVNNRAIAIIIANESYESTHFRRKSTLRSGQLMAEYLNLSLGYSRDRIININDFTAEIDVETLLNIDLEEQTISGIPYSTQSDIFIYYAGHAGMIEIDGNIEPAILPVDMVPGDGITVAALFQSLAAMHVAGVHVVLDTDFTFRTSTGSIVFNANMQIELASILTKQRSNNSVIYSVTGNQTSGTYQSNDLRTDRVHGLLTYYFVKSIQNGITDLSSIHQYLQRNMTFTSRRLHNRAQDPLGFIPESVNLLRFTPEF
jgi:hypothetical protein